MQRVTCTAGVGATVSGFTVVGRGQKMQRRRVKTQGKTGGRGLKEINRNERRRVGIKLRRKRTVGGGRQHKKCEEC